MTKAPPGGRINVAAVDGAGSKPRETQRNAKIYRRE